MIWIIPKTNWIQQAIVSDKIEATHELPQTVLDLLLFLICINDLNEAVSHSLTHHFADDTNILSHKSLKKVKKYIDLSQTVQ